VTDVLQPRTSRDLSRAHPTSAETLPRAGTEQ
jgi:hypothetical protein